MKREVPQSLNQIKAPIEKELDVFERRFKDAMKSRVPLLDRVTYYIVQRKGKQMRPMFVLLSAKMLGEIRDKTYVAASLVELLHTATLVHDDVVDDAYMRRGFFSINALWKNKIAVLVGDYLLSRGLLLSLEHEHFDLLKILSAAVKEMSEGELLQIEKARRLDIKEEIYYEIIRQKTASLIASACASGASSVSDVPAEVEKMRLFGEKVGMAFQIKDDLFDYGDADIGKPRGIDIKERKMTLPLIYTLNNSSSSEKRWIINVFKNHNKEAKKVKEVLKFVKEKGGLEYATKKMEHYRDEAFNILKSYPSSESRESLEQLIKFTIERES